MDLDVFGWVVGSAAIAASVGLGISSIFDIVRARAKKHA
jgi:hypothetical protein